MLGNYGKNADIHPKYETLVAFPWQQRLCEHDSLLHYLYITCPIFIQV